MACSDSFINPAVSGLYDCVSVHSYCSQASRVEFRLVARQFSSAEQRCIEQQTLVDSLQAKLTAIADDLETASGSAGKEPAECEWE
jgi:hypothetical protein